MIEEIRAAHVVELWRTQGKQEEEESLMIYTHQVCVWDQQEETCDICKKLEGLPSQWGCLYAVWVAYVNRAANEYGPSQWVGAH
jgi:hypothetical protein